MSWGLYILVLPHSRARAYNGAIMEGGGPIHVQKIHDASWNYADAQRVQSLPEPTALAAASDDLRSNSGGHQ
jgi:hypothetical protein